jgi:prepilin-type N-terminal cleavage/methylation domain-containing protein
MRAGGAGNLTSQSGFTLTELLVAAFIMALIILGASRLFVTAQQTFARQTSKTEMHLNAAFASRHLAELLEEASADLPVRMPSVQVHSQDCVTVVRNPRPGAAAVLLGGDIDPVLGAVSVPDVGPFRGYANLNYLPPGASAYGTKAVETNNTGPFVNGFDTVNNVIDLADVSGMSDSTCVFIAESHDYFLHGTNLCRDDTAYVLAEHIAALSVAILDTAQAPAAWDDRRFFRVSVTATTGRTGRMADSVTLMKTGAFQNL